MSFEDPVSLRLFIAVCETGSIAKAADREAISPSALSKRISDLEESLDTPLLDRGQRGVTPTPAGQALIAHARQILRNLKQMHSEVSEYGSGVRGHVRVMAVTSSIVEFLPEELASFLRTHPDIRISVEEAITVDVERAIRAGTADLGVCRSLPASSDLQLEDYSCDHFAVIVEENHPLADRKSLRFEDTLDYEHVGLPIHGLLRTITDRVARDLSREVKTRFQVSTFDSALRVVQSGLALGIMPLEAISRFRGIYSLCTIPLDEEWATQRFFLCTRKDEFPSPAVRRLLKFLRERKPEADSLLSTRE